MEQRLPCRSSADFVDVSDAAREPVLRAASWKAPEESAWGIYKKHDGADYLRRVNTKTNGSWALATPSRPARAS